MSIHILLIGHTIACFWHAVAYYNVEILNTWLHHLDLVNADNLTKYNYSFYWAIQTITTTGYGNITPCNNLEIIYTNVIMIISLGVFAFAITTIGIELQNIHIKNQKERVTIQIINKYMRDNSVNYALQSKIRSHLKEIWFSQYQADDQKISQIVNHLSVQLQEDLQQQISGNMIKGCELLQKFSQSTQFQLAQHMKEFRLSPCEQIIEQNNQSDDGSLYFIVDGDISIIFNSKQNDVKNQLQTLSAGQTFGELKFITGRPRSASAISLGFSKLIKISRQQFLKTIQNNSNDLEVYKTLQDQIMLYKNYKDLGIQCYCCLCYDHLCGTCPTIHYEVDFETVVKKLQFTQDQERAQGNQKYNINTILGSFHKKKKFKTFLQNKYIQVRLKDFQIQPIQNVSLYSSIDAESNYRYDRTFSAMNLSKNPSYALSPSHAASISHAQSISIAASPSQIIRRQSIPQISDDQSSESQTQNSFIDFQKQDVYSRQMRTNKTIATAGFGKQSSPRDKLEFTNLIVKDKDKKLSNSKNELFKRCLSYAIRPNQIGKIFDINEKEFFRERSKSFTYANIVSHQSESRNRNSQVVQKQLSSYLLQPSMTSSIPSIINQRNSSSQSQLGSNVVLKSDLENIQIVSSSDNFRIHDHNYDEFGKPQLKESIRASTQPLKIHNSDVLEYQQKREDFFIEGFEKMMEYPIYFPQNNYPLVLPEFNQFQSNINEGDKKLSRYSNEKNIKMQKAEGKKKKIENLRIGDIPIHLEPKSTKQKSQIILAGTIMS